MADLYSVVQGLTPSPNDLLEAELLSTQILQANFPDLDLRQGTAVRDLVIRPAALLFALCKLGTDYYFAQNTIANVTDTTPTDMVDSIMSNWFMTRNIGLQSIISARLYFARQKNVNISSDTYFSPDNILKFYPSVSAAYNASSLQFDSFSNEYYIDINLTAAAEGSSYNLASGSLLYFSNFDPYFLRAEINYLVSSSIDTETNTQFITRAQSAISTRNLINIPSVAANLQSQFNYIDKLVTVGMGNPDMIRDQVNIMLDTTLPIQVSSLTSVGTLATVTLNNHGFNNGQLITIAGAFPTGYNGQYAINIVNTNVFTYVLSTSLGAISVLPTVQSFNSPLSIHNGGMVDVYSSDTLASSIIQTTTDAYGNAVITGPVYNLSRSSISGGALPDTLPLVSSLTTPSITTSGLTATIAVSANPVPAFIIGDILTITGATQHNSVTALSCSGLVATATVSSNDYVVGNIVTITGDTSNLYNGTFTITAVTSTSFSWVVPVNIATAATGTLIADINLFNSSFVITGISGFTLTFTIPQTTTIPIAGTIVATTPLNYSVVNPNALAKPIISITSTTTEATATVSHHGYTANRSVTITGSPTSQFNGIFLIDTIISPDQFTYSLPTSVSATSSGGLSTFVIPAQDWGFSEKQSVLVKFGSSYPFMTVSFDIGYFQNLDSIQNYLNSANNRVVCADYLARGFNFYYLNINIISYNTTAPNSGVAAGIIQNYLSNLPVGGIFIISDMMTQLRLNGILNIQNPPSVTYTRYTRDLTTPLTGVITDVLDPKDDTNVFLLNTVNTYSASV